MSPNPLSPDSFSNTVTMRNNLPIALVSGYFAEMAGLDFLARVQPLLKEGKTRLIVDFTNCHVINSPGMVRLMELTLQVVEDYQGTIYLTGLSELNLSVLELAGVFPLAELAPTIEEAFNRLTA